MTKKTAIVTGAARGIGLATTHLFLEEGRQVAMIDRDADELMKVADGLTNVLPIICDVSQPDQVAAMISRVEKEMNRVDALERDLDPALGDQACAEDHSVVGDYEMCCRPPHVADDHPNRACDNCRQCEPPGSQARRGIDVGDHEGADTKCDRQNQCDGGCREVPPVWVKVDSNGFVVIEEAPRVAHGSADLSQQIALLR